MSEQEELLPRVDQRPDNVKPPQDTDFDAGYEMKALPEGRIGGGVGGFNDWIFSLMRKGSKKSSAKKTLTAQINNKREFVADPRYKDYCPRADIPLYQGLPISPKTTFEIARDQLKNRLAFTVSHKFINGFALVILLTGVFVIYSSIPTHPEVVVGIVMVSLAGNVLVSRG
jgi:hypothetical protein